MRGTSQKRRFSPKQASRKARHQPKTSFFAKTGQLLSEGLAKNVVLCQNRLVAKRGTSQKRRFSPKQASCKARHQPKTSFFAKTGQVLSEGLAKNVVLCQNRLGAKRGTSQKRSFSPKQASCKARHQPKTSFYAKIGQLQSEGLAKNVVLCQNRLGVTRFSRTKCTQEMRGLVLNKR